MSKVYLIDRATGVTVEDFDVNDTNELCLSWPGHPDQALDPAEFRAVIEGGLRWMLETQRPKLRQSEVATLEAAIEVVEMFGRPMTTKEGDRRAQRSPYAFARETEMGVIDADKSPDPSAVDALASLMSDISQEHYCAGWMNDLEQRLWGMLQGKDRQYGNGVVSDANIAELRSLSERCGGWIVWQNRGAGPEPSGMKFVTIAEWATRG